MNQTNIEHETGKDFRRKSERERGMLGRVSARSYTPTNAIKNNRIGLTILGTSSRCCSFQFRELHRTRARQINIEVSLES